MRWRGSRELRLLVLANAPAAIAGQVAKFLLGARGPKYRGLVDLCIFTEPDDDAAVASREIAAATVNPTNEFSPAHFQFHACTDRVPVALLAVAFEFEPDPVIVGDRRIAKKLHGAGIMAD